MKSYEEFLKSVCQREASGNYKAENSLGYKGCYQMGVPAMVDIGYYKENSGSNIYDNKWHEGHFTDKSGIKNVKDFLNNPSVQDKAIEEYKKRQWGYMKDVQNYVGKTVGGILITESGMLGAAQMGHDKVIKYLKSNGKIIEKDGNGVPVTEYLKLFKDYDVSRITRPTLQSNPRQSIHQQSVNKQINQNSNYNTLNNLLNPVSKLKQNSIIQIKSKPTGFAAPIEQATTPQVSYTPEQIGKMSREEFDKNESSIMHQLQTGGFNQNPSRDFGGYRNSHTGDNRIYTAEDIGNFSISEFSHHEPAINAQMNTIGIPTNNDMQNSGGTVYIAPYTRSDGIQVRGHYRSR